jgi:predicted transcriptional regulator
MGRRKLDENRKKQKLSTTINDDLWKLLEQYADDIDRTRTSVIERWLKDGLKNQEIIDRLKKENIILPNSNI